MVRNFRKPLIVVGPKLLLRLPVSESYSLVCCIVDSEITSVIVFIAFGNSARAVRRRKGDGKVFAGSNFRPL